MAIIITFTTLGFFVGFVYRGRIYKTLSVNILEALSYLNLILLSALTVAQVGPLVYSLMGIELVLLFTVIIYHFHSIPCTARLIAFLKLKIARRKAKHFEVQPQKVEARASSQDTHKTVSKTVIEIREPLLDQ